MRDIVVGHGQDEKLGDGAGLAFNPPRPLVERSQVGVEVARVAAAPGDLLPGCGDLAERFRVVGDVRSDHEDVKAMREGEVLGYRQRDARRE